MVIILPHQIICEIGTLCGLLHLQQYSKEGIGRAAGPLSRLLAILLYNSLLLCSFKVPIKGLTNYSISI